MSAVVIRVELPAHSQSFQVSVPPASTIRDVKLEIAKVCPGSPSVEGQRLVWRGRFLKDDEGVRDLWQSLDDVQTVHLAVHPSAWSSGQPTPPTVSSTPPSPPIPVLQTSTPASPANSIGTHGSPSGFIAQTPLSWLIYRHNLALHYLSAGTIPYPPPPSNDMDVYLPVAKDAFFTRGWAWPAILEESFPPASPRGEGLQYEATTVEGLPYLSLLNPTASPTPAQVHALKVLNHTFSILSVADPHRFPIPTGYSSPGGRIYRATTLNDRLQQLGLPQLRVAGNGPGNDVNNRNAPEIRAIPLRALMLPLLMLAFRTLLLLYFFSPSKRPLFGIMLSVWILYEAWNAMRIVFADINENPQQAGMNGNRNAAAPGAVNARPGPGGVVPPPMRRGSGLGNMNAEGILDAVGQINMGNEEAALEDDSPAALPPPGIFQKAKVFVILFLVTFYPAAWDRRRKALRRREGKIRTEANAREAGPTPSEDTPGTAEDGQTQTRADEEATRARVRADMIARHERRPVWVREYMRRVQYSEWVDDP